MKKKTTTKKMKLKKKTIFQRLVLGFKKGWSTPTLPNHIIKLQNNVFIRFLRVLGGISIILIITHRLEILGNGILYNICLIICIVFSLIFSIYLLYVNYHRIKHMYKILKNDEIEIRNSPFDRFATFAARLLWCSKGFCEVAAPIGVTYGAMAGIDELRKIKGYEPIFLPFLSKFLIPDNELTKIYEEQRKMKAYLTQNSIESKIYSEELELVDKLTNNNFINKEEADQWKRDISENHSLLNQNTDKLKSKILSNLSKLEEIRKNRK